MCLSVIHSHGRESKQILNRGSHPDFEIQNAIAISE